jgi:hypothetical protein
VINATAPGYYVAHQRITVIDRRLQHLTIELAELPPPAIVRSNAPWIVVGAGAAIAAAGAVVHVFSLAPLRDQLVRDSNPQDSDPTDYHATVGRFESRRRLVVGLYATGAATALTGLLLRQLGWRSHPLDINPERGGAVVSIRGAFR